MIHICSYGKLHAKSIVKTCSHAGMFYCSLEFKPNFEVAFIIIILEQIKCRRNQKRDFNLTSKQVCKDRRNSQL